MLLDYSSKELLLSVPKNDKSFISLYPSAQHTLTFEFCRLWI